ncbi:MAG TPA: hypothetical protein VGM76_18110 [Lacipirellulaceae bacterium]|jgi:hypothetical protein
MKTQLLALGALVLALMISSTASAQYCGGGYGGGCGYDYGYLYNSLDYNVPYFAAHPPVYYSYPVPRTYGYSPFAYPPYVMTPDVAQDSAPIEITNPYVPSSKQEKSKDQSDQTAARTSPHNEPLVIINPYVSTKESIAGMSN